MRSMVLATIGAALTLTGCIPRLYSAGTDIDVTGGDWVAPENDWPIATPPANIAGEGYDVGQVVPEFLLTDQFGADVSLWQFYGNVILLDISTIWCAPCQELASHAEDTWLDYRDRGFMHVTVLQEDLEGDPPDGADLNEWVEAFDLTTPVLADPDLQTGDAIRAGQFPTVLLINRDLVIVDRVGTTEDEVRRAIESEL